MALPPVLGVPGVSGSIQISGTVNLTASNVTAFGSQNAAVTQDAATKDLKVIVDSGTINASITNTPNVNAGVIGGGGAGAFASSADVQALNTDLITTGIKISSGTVTAIGAAANGAAVANNPVLMAGSDGANVRTLATDASGNLKIVTPSGQVVTVNVNTGTYTDRSGTLTTGGTAQQLAASNSTRKKIYVINQDDSGTGEALYINFTTTATTTRPSIKLAVGAQWSEDASAITTEAISVIAATTGHSWIAKEM